MFFLMQGQQPISKEATGKAPSMKRQRYGDTQASSVEHSHPSSSHNTALAAVNGVVCTGTLVPSNKRDPAEALTNQQGDSLEGLVEEDEGAKNEGYMCSKCLLVCGHVTYKREHNKERKRGVCNTENITKEALFGLKEAAMKAMHAKNHVNKLAVKHFGCPEYLAYLAK